MEVHRSPSSTDPSQTLHELRTLVGLGEEEIRLLREMQAVLEQALPEAIAMIRSRALADSHLGRVLLSGGRDRAQIEENLLAWARRLIGGDYGPEFATERAHIGQRHQHLGIDPRHAIWGANVLRTVLGEVIAGAYGDDPTELCARLSALNKVIDLDLGLITNAFSFEQEAVIVGEKERERRGLEERLSGITDSPNILILAVDQRGDVQSVNGTLLEHTGFDEQTLVGQPFVDALIPEESRETVRGLLADCLRRPEHECEKLQDALPLATSSGEVLWIAWYPTAIRDADGAVEELVLLGHDITDKRLLEQEIIHQDKMAALGLMAAGVAHEIGNPLASISSVTQTLQRKVADSYVHDKLALVSKNIDRITSIVRHLVDFARPPRLEWKVCSVASAVRNAVDLIRFDRRGKRVAIHLDLPADLPDTYAIEDRLTQVCFNIVLNAVDALQELDGQRAPELTIRARTKETIHGRTIEVRFRDNGPGMTAEVASRAFEPFFTTKEVGRGTGLGLAVSYRIIEEHSGTIQVHSEPGHGAEFVVDIPVKKKRSEES